MFNSKLAPNLHARKNRSVWSAGLGSQIERLQSRELLSATNFSEVVFYDGETTGPAADTPLLNRFGGGTVAGLAGGATTAYETVNVRSGNGALRIQTNRSIPVGQFDFVQQALTGQFFNYVDTRDLSNFDELRFWMSNATGSPFKLDFQIKDFLDSNVTHKAEFTFDIPASAEWAEYVVPLDFSDSGWTVFGDEPDLSRARFLGYIIQADTEPVSGELYLDDIVLHEKGGALNPTSAPANRLLDRVISRQFGGIWGSRDRNTGLIPNISSQADVMTTNATAGLIQMLPEAIRRGLVGQTEADSEVALVVSTMNTAWNQVESGGSRRKQAAVAADSFHRGPWTESRWPS